MSDAYSLLEVIYSIDCSNWKVLYL